MTLPGRGQVWWARLQMRRAGPISSSRAMRRSRSSARCSWHPITRTIRRIPTEVPLGTDEGLPIGCVAAFDATTVFPRAMLVRRMGSVAPTRLHELCEAFAAVTDC